MLFEWRNLPYIVSRGSLNRTVTWDEHREWLQRSLQDGEQRRLFIIEHEETPIGQVRFDRLGERACAISAYVLEGFAGRGLGTAAIHAGCAAIFADWPVAEIVAQVRHDNPAGLAAFLKTGFLRRTATLAEHDELVRVRRPDFGDPAQRMVPHNRLTHGLAEEQAAARCVASGRWAMGPGVARLEARLAELAPGRHAVAVASGLAALRLALRAVGVVTGDRVLVPAYSCVALADAVLAVGGEPVAMDVDAERYNLDVAAARAQIERRPKAAIVVHTFGARAAVEAARAWGIPVIEDCAHGFSAGLGVLGDVSVLSFYATKLIGAGEGGAVLTRSPDTAAWLRAERDYTDRAPAPERNNDKPTELAAVLALCQLDRLPELVARRRELAARYHRLLAPLARDRFALPVDEERIWYRYVIALGRHVAADVVSDLARLGVGAAEPVCDWRPVPERARQPVATWAYRHALSLPLYPTLTSGEQDQVVAALDEVLK
jgi:perosamine synthetase